MIFKENIYPRLHEVNTVPVRDGYGGGSSSGPAAIPPIQPFDSPPRSLASTSCLISF